MAIAAPSTPIPCFVTRIKSSTIFAIAPILVLIIDIFGFPKDIMTCDINNVILKNTLPNITRYKYSLAKGNTFSLEPNIISILSPNKRTVIVNSIITE